jgi:CheY-like chemotaxis protein
MEGYRTVIVHEPAQVLEAARQAQPVLILMDVHTGQSDTLGVLSEVRADTALGSVPVIMTSGMDHSAECTAAGATKFILKPFQPFDLLDMIGELTRGE